MAHAGNRPDGHARLLEGAGMEFQPGDGKVRAETAIHRRGVAEPETMRIDKNVFPHGSRYGILDVEQKHKSGVVFTAELKLSQIGDEISEKEH